MAARARSSDCVAFSVFLLLGWLGGLHPTDQPEPGLVGHNARPRRRRYNAGRHRTENQRSSPFHVKRGSSARDARCASRAFQPCLRQSPSHPGRRVIMKCLQDLPSVPQPDARVRRNANGPNNTHHDAFTAQRKRTDEGIQGQINLRRSLTRAGHSRALRIHDIIRALHAPATV